MPTTTPRYELSSGWKPDVRERKLAEDALAAKEAAMSPEDRRVSQVWRHQKDILDATLAAGRSLTAEERAEIERLDRELDEAIEVAKAAKVADADPLARVLEIMDKADGRALTKNQTDAFERFRPQLARQFADLTDAYSRSLLDRAQEVGPDNPEIFRELARWAERQRLITKTGAFHQVDRIETSRGAGPRTDAPLYSRLFGGSEQRALMTSTSTSALATTQYWPDFSDHLANASVALQAGIKVIDTDATSVKIPRGTALATGAWLAEGATAVASDLGVAAVTITPARLTVYGEVTREALEDNGVVLEAVTRHMFMSLGQLLDSAIFEGAGTSNEPQGMRNLAASGTVSSGSTAVDLGYFVSAFEQSLAANAPVKAWATNSAAWGVYASLRIGGTASYDLRPLLTTDADRAAGAAIAGNVLGAPLYITGSIDALGAGTAAVYGFDPEQVWLVRRRAFDMIQDPYTKAEQGIVRLIMEGRFGVAFPQPSAINVFTVLTP